MWPSGHRVAVLSPAIYAIVRPLHPGPFFRFAFGQRGSLPWRRGVSPVCADRVAYRHMLAVVVVEHLYDDKVMPLPYFLM